MSSSACFRFFVLPYLFHSLGLKNDISINAKIKKIPRQNIAKKSIKNNENL